VKDVAADRHRKPREVLARLAPVGQRLAQGKRVEQRLRGMFVLPVARIQDRTIDQSRDKLGRPARSVTDHDAIGAHGVERDRRVDQRLALFHAAGGGVHVDDIRAQPLASDLEAQQRARRIFEEGVDDGEAGQRIVMFVPLAVQIDPLFRLVEQEQDFMPFELRDVCQVAMREGEPTRRVAAAGGGDFGRCH
jgi:hypothetical protein